MPVLTRGDETILFVHIPKCGGSSFLSRMDDRGWREHLSIRGMHLDQLHFLYCTPQHMHADLLQHLIRPETFDHVVTLVREPLERLKSEYAWQRHQGITNLSPEDWIDHALSEFEENPFAYDNHIRPQHEFLLEQSKTFKLEDAGVSRALDMVSPDPPERSFLDYLMGRTPDRKLKETEKPQSVEQAFHKKSTQIQDFYVRDYNTLDYRRSR